MRESNTHEQFRINLDDGTPALFRTVRSEDQDALRKGLEYLSERSRYLRFFSYIDHLTEEQLEYLTRVDQKKHIAWGALDLNHPEVPGMGIGRIIQSDSKPRNAEMAITIADHYQKRGLGKIIFALLYQRAQEEGIQKIGFYVMPMNRFLCSKLKNAGAEIRYEEGVFQIELPVYKDVSKIVDSPDAQPMQQLMDRLKQLRREKDNSLLEHLKQLGRHF